MNTTLHFKNGKFKIMQITDTQEVAKVNPDTVRLITLAIEKEKPDLIVFTGDQIKGYSATFRGDTYKKIEKTIDEILSPIKERNIPFCVTFGNHDRDCGISNYDQMPIYRKYENFICGNPRSDEDPGTFSIQLKDSKNEKDIFNLYVFDSNRKDENGSYSPLFPIQIDWYKSERERIFKENGKYLPSLVFQHIPLPEYYDVIKKVPKRTKGAVEAFFSHKNEFYVLDDEALNKGYFMLESPATPDRNTGEFEALKEKGEVLGVFVGHDHNNSFVLNKDGIDLSYTQGAGFNVYGPGAKRGVRIFNLDESNPDSYETYTVTMEELCNFKPTRPVGEFVLTHSPTSVKVVIRAGIRVAVVSAVIATSAVILKNRK